MPAPTVLIVDDELANLQKLKRTFLDVYDVYEASGGEEALQLLRQSKCRHNWDQGLQVELNYLSVRYNRYPVRRNNWFRDFQMVLPPMRHYHSKPKVRLKCLTK